MSGIKDGFVMKRLVVLCMALVTALAVSAPASARCREAGSLNGLRYEVRLGWGGYPAADVANFVDSDNPFFRRGGGYHFASAAGVFDFGLNHEVGISLPRFPCMSRSTVM